MKNFFSILLLLPFLIGCSNEETLLSERDKIEKFLTSTRGMVPQEELDNVIADNPKFYTTHGRYSYRHIVNYYDEGREDRAQVEWGDRLEISFTAYVFSGSELSTKDIYWSNRPEVIKELVDKKSDTLDWSTEPLAITLGETPILAGLEQTLPGCYEEDEVQVFMTSSLAYGKQLIGNVPKNSMVAWNIKITKVTK